MAKQNVSKKYAVSAVGILSIEDGIINIEVEDKGIYRLDKLLQQFDGLQVKIGVTYDEESESPSDVDAETGEVVD